MVNKIPPRVLLSCLTFKVTVNISACCADLSPCLQAIYIKMCEKYTNLHRSVASLGTDMGMLLVLQMYPSLCDGEILYPAPNCLAALNSLVMHLNNTRRSLLCE